MEPSRDKEQYTIMNITINSIDIKDIDQDALKDALTKINGVKLAELFRKPGSTWSSPIKFSRQKNPLNGRYLMLDSQIGTSKGKPRQ